MTNPHVTERLRLWVGGDLSPRESETVAAHLEDCPVCRAEAESLRQSLAWMKAGMKSPFTPEDRAAFRRETLARVREEAPPRRSSTVSQRLRPLLLMAAAALMAVVAFRWMHPGRKPFTQPTVPPSPVARLAPARTIPPDPARTQPRPVRVRSRPHPTPAALEPGFTRLELQTADPSIRIIWLARAAPMADLPETSHP